MESVRLPRFKRSPDIASMRLTQRDREILTHIHRHRFLRPNHLPALMPGSPQQLLRRLQLLYHHGFLDRPRCQIDYYHRSGSRSIVYGIGNKGAGLLKSTSDLPIPRPVWPRENNVERLFLEHTLLTADFMVRLEIACREKPNIRLLTAEELETAPRQRQPFQWKVELGRGQRCGIIPDRVFGLEFLNEPAPQNRVWFFLEADRGTMPVTRRRLDQTSYNRKLLAYQVTWTSGSHRKLGFPRFRVLTVTNSSARLERMIETCRELEKGRGLFLFTDVKSLRAHSDLLALPWQTVHRESTERLLPAQSASLS